MTQIINRMSALRLLLVVAFSAALFSFTSLPGGDTFEILLNDKLMFRQFVWKEDGVKTVQLSERNSNDALNITYSHCGKTGTARSISVKDLQNNVLKSWKFSDVNGSTSQMSCKVKDILALQKLNHGVRLNLYYSSNELPDGRILAAITGSNDKASLH